MDWEYDTVEKLHHYTRQAAQQYFELISQVREAYELHSGHKALIKYEDLRRDTLGTLRAMYSALKMTIDDKQLQASVDKHRWEQIPEEEKGPGQFYRKALPGGWEEDLSAEQVKIVEDITGPILREFYGVR